MITSFSHKGLEAFFLTGTKAGIQPHHATKLRLQLTLLDSAKEPRDMGVPSWKLHPLSNGLWAISVNGNWRMTFACEGGNASIVDYVDYH